MYYNIIDGWLAIKRSVPAHLWSGHTLWHEDAILVSHSQYGTRCCGQGRLCRVGSGQTVGKPLSHSQPTLGQRQTLLQSGENFDDLCVSILTLLWSTKQTCMWILEVQHRHIPMIMIICPRSLSIQVNGNRDHVDFCQVQANCERFFKLWTHAQLSCFNPVRSACDFRYTVEPLYSGHPWDS